MIKRELPVFFLIFSVGLLLPLAACKGPPPGPSNKAGERSATKAAAALAPSNLPPASNPPQSPAPTGRLPEGNRFLFVIENSLGTERIDQPMRQAFFDILYCGVCNHLQPGDTFGVWTFNATTCTEYPMQVWQPTNRLELASRATQFVKGRGYGKQARIELLISDLVRVVRAARDVNILIFSDGNNKFKGTPFDRQINTFFKEKGQEFRQRKDPFVITLIARGGELISWAVNQPGDLIAQPLTPPPPTNLAATPAAVPVDPLPKKPAREPIVMTATKKPAAISPPTAVATNSTATLIPIRETNVSATAITANVPGTAALTNSIVPTLHVIATATNVVAKPIVTIVSTNSTPTQSNSIPTVAANALARLQTAPIPVAARERDSNAVPSAIITGGTTERDISNE